MTETRFLISSDQFEPAYMELFRSGELYRRSRQGLRHLEKCRVCPRDCDVNRLSNEWALCKTGRYAWVSSYFPHFGEENCLRGTNGSGTIFFSMCNLKCVFCQNYDISQQQDGMEATPEVLANMMMELQTKGCHNINFVTPEHVVPQILEALPMAVQMGLRLPLVYNSGAFDSMESLRLMEGVIDIYMPDFKYWTAEDSAKYLKATRYPEVAREVVREMHRQVGPLTFDENGLAKRGVLVRHLVMPDSLENTKSIMQFLSEELSPDTYVNVMDQYRPAGKVTPERFPTLARRTTNEEHDQAVEITLAAGLTRIDHRSAQGQ